MAEEEEEGLDRPERRVTVSKGRLLGPSRPHEPAWTGASPQARSGAKLEDENEDEEEHDEAGLADQTTATASGPGAPSVEHHAQVAQEAARRSRQSAARAAEHAATAHAAALRSAVLTAGQGASDEPIALSDFGLEKPLGHGAAVEAAGLMAAPPLAGFTFALIVLILQVPDALRWPDAALFLLAVAGLAFLVVIQSAVRARQFSLDPALLAALKELVAGVGLPALTSEQQDKGRRARTATRLAYNVALAFFFAGVGSSLVSETSMTDWRYAAIAVVAVGLLLEIKYVWQALVDLVAQSLRPGEAV